jgi:hypothetical protein
MSEGKERRLLVSYVALRRLIGILGMLLPFVCLFCGWLFAGLPLQDSISQYYHTNVRDFLVGLLIGMSFFLITYTGYELIDDIVTSASALAGFGIAVFPCLLSEASTDPVGIFRIDPRVSDTVHFICASIFFALLAFNSIFLFTRTKKDVPMSDRKKARNAIYIACGVVISLSLAVLGVLLLVKGWEWMRESRLIFVFETVMLFFFGASWLVKGETLLPDPGIGGA